MSASRVAHIYSGGCCVYNCQHLLIDFSGEKSVVKSAVTGLIVAAVAAGLAAVMNLSKGGCADDNG